MGSVVALVVPLESAWHSLFGELFFSSSDDDDGVGLLAFILNDQFCVLAVVCTCFGFLDVPCC